MEPRWYEDGGQRVFKVRMNDGKDPTIVFHIAYISQMNVRQDSDGSMFVSVEFNASDFSYESEIEWVGTPAPEPKLKGRQLLILEGEENDK